MRPFTLDPTLVLLRLGAALAVLSSCKDVSPPPHPVENFQVVEEGRIYAGSRPDVHGLRSLDSLGVNAILNLERDLWGETSAEVEREWKTARRIGLQFVHLPLHPTRAPTWKELDWAVNILADPSVHPVFVHDDQGSARTGMVVAGYRIRVQGWSPERAYEEMTERGFHEILHFGWRDQLFDWARSRAPQTMPEGAPQ